VIKNANLRRTAMFPNKSPSGCTPVPAASPDTWIPDSTTKWPDLCVASCFRFASLPFTFFFYAMQDSDFGPEDEFNASIKPLFDRNAAQSIYRPKIAPLSIPKKSTEIWKRAQRPNFSPIGGAAAMSGTVPFSSKRAPDSMGFVGICIQVAYYLCNFFDFVFY